MPLRATPEIVIALLRAELGTGAQPPAERLTECDWQRFEVLAAHHGLAAILYTALRTHTNHPPAAPMQRMKRQYFHNALRSMRANELINDVASALAEQGIPVILLKGMALLHTLYDDPGLRPLTDVDLLVAERDVQRAATQLRRIGLEEVPTADVHRRGPLCHMHAVYCRSETLPVELHWRLFESYQPYVFDLAEVWTQARPLPALPGNVLTMSAEHELLHLCVHLERHAVAYASLLSRADWFDLLLLPQGGGRLLWLYDVAAYLRRRSLELDWDLFTRTARRWAIAGRVHAVLELCTRALGAAPPPEAMRTLDSGGPRLADRLAHRVVLASFIANEACRSSRRARWLAWLSGHALRASHTWTSLLPPTAYLRARYAPHSSVRALRMRHLREVVPGLWAESRERLKHASKH